MFGVLNLISDLLNLLAIRFSIIFIKFYDLKKLQKGPVYNITFSPDNNTIVSVGEDKKIRLWKNSVLIQFLLKYSYIL